MGPQAGESVGAVLNGHWKLVRLIGEGGLAAVYEGHGLQGQGRRAIKLLHPQFVREPVIVERFYAEAQTCYALQHPKICTVEAYAYAEDGSPYIVMDLLEGMSLEEFLEQDRVMTPQQAAPLLAAVLDALGAAHARSIVHRDLKPANLFLLPTEQGGYDIRVLDFGIAKVMDLAGGMGNKTRTGAMLGTPGYMSPEQVRDAKSVDARSDLWAAGVVFYEMLSGTHPYGSESDMARMVAVLRQEATPIREVAPALAAWDGFFVRALARDPAARFQSAQEMASALQQAAGGVAAGTRPAAARGTEAMPVVPDLTASAAAPAATAPSTSASPAVSAYGDGGAGRYPSGHPPAPSAQLPPAYDAALRAASSTQISGGRPEGTPTYHSDVPPVHVVSARDEVLSLVWWAAALVAFGTFAFGLLLGYLLGAS